MGISERKERQKAELRDTILCAARRIFIDEGADALTMRRIADAIEYSPGTLYLYFASREEIALHLVREGFATLLARLQPPAAIDDPVERLRALARAYIDFGRTDPQTYKLMFMTDAKYVYAGFDPDCAAISGDPGQRAFALLAKAIRDAVMRERLKPIDSEAAAHVLWAGLHGVLSLHITSPMMLDDAGGVGALLAEMLVDGLRR